MQSLLLIFTKNPTLGKVKTRLAKDIGPSRALKIHQALVQKTQQAIAPLPFKKALFYSDFIPKDDTWSPHVDYRKVQEGKDLGQRMEAAFDWGFSHGYRNIIIIGTDLWEINTEIIHHAFALLEKNHTVIGPAKDGGYYLLGLNKKHPEIFRNKNWGWETVLEDTLQDLKPQKPILLAEKNDIDYLDDVREFPELESLLKP
jgi:rSAM/selenodomain-associated transferase 1